jgi:UDP-GlcNAc:undecaprenyl-phosphate GlcNAc-1-phosphate transferase
MKNLWLSSLIAFTVSILTIPLAVFLSLRWGAVSETGGRHVGCKPVGRLGGLSVLTGTISSIVILSTTNSSIGGAVETQSYQLFGLLVGVIFIGGVGFWDDIHRLPAKTKLAFQLLVATESYLVGLGVYSVDLPLLEPIQLGWFAYPITVFWIIGVVNAINLIDGLDGLAGGVVMFASLVNLVAAITGGSVLSAAIMAAVAGAVLGFLVYNWHPAKIYLGDGGAYSLGYLLATSALLSPHQKTSTGVALLIPVLAAGLPIFDTLLTMIRRAFNRQGIFIPDRGHLHHILLDAGISHRGVVIGLYTLSCVFSSIAVTVVLNRNRVLGFWLVVCSLFGAIFWIFVFRKRLTTVVESKCRPNDPIKAGQQQ